jgi:hypothetical protein
MDERARRPNSATSSTGDIWKGFGQGESVVVHGLTKVCVCVCALRTCAFERGCARARERET